MSIVISCECGKQLRARDELAGRKAKCPGCGRVLTVPEKPFDPEEDLIGLAPLPTEKPHVVAPTQAMHVAPSATASRDTHATPKVSRPIAAPVALNNDSSSSRHFREFVYGVLILALIPLLISTFKRHDPEEIPNRIHQTVQSHPEIREKVAALSDEATLDDFIDLMPGHKIDGALLAHDSSGHWVIAMISGGVFFCLVMLIFPLGTANPGRLVAIGAFTATLGILFLLGVQYAAMYTYGRIFYGRSIITLIFYILKFIGFSYRAALDPDTNFFVSFFGFTFGVGMCEELCKALPVLVPFKGKADITWRAACMWGLISGVGFGVSEGITYSSDFYNGISGLDTYLVRFVSCVALHAIWAGAAAIFIYKQQALLNSAESIWGTLFNCVVLVSVPMVLHGAYDTLLKKHYGVGALLAAIVSFAWFAWQIETARHYFDEQEKPRKSRAIRQMPADAGV